MASMKATEWLVAVSRWTGPGQTTLHRTHRTRSRKRARRLAREARRAGHVVESLMQRCPGCPWTAMGEKLRPRGLRLSQAANVLGSRFIWYMPAWEPRIGGIVVAPDMREALTSGH